MTDKGYEPGPGLLVLSADLTGGFAPPETLINRVPLTRIYRDGRIVFVDPARGSSEIFEGHLDARKISQLFELLQAKGFFGLSGTYVRYVPTDLPSNVVTARRRGEPEKRVSSYGGVLSAPAGFMDCYQALLYPQLQPSDVKAYVRRPITDQELEAGSYPGSEYQKKLNTPRDWVWVEAGRSSQWRRPEAHAHAVTLDSGFMIPPIDGCGHLRVHYRNSPAAAGSTVQFDRNAMSPNEFGDIGTTTLMYFAPRTATFTPLENKGGEHLFSITVPGYSGPKLRLVVMGDLAQPSGGRILAMEDHGVIQNIYPLQPVPEHALQPVPPHALQALPPHAPRSLPQH
jgi:hypothetical protein